MTGRESDQEHICCKAGDAFGSRYGHFKEEAGLLALTAMSKTSDRTQTS